MFSPPGRFIGGGRAGGTFFLSLSPIVRPAYIGGKGVSRVRGRSGACYAMHFIKQTIHIKQDDVCCCCRFCVVVDAIWYSV